MREHGLTASTASIQLGGERYLAVLIPSAPVPFGGALVYVPAAWVEPAEGGIDELMSVYVSMGITPPGSPAKGAISLDAAAQSACAATHCAHEQDEACPWASAWHVEACVLLACAAPLSRTVFPVTTRAGAIISVANATEVRLIQPPEMMTAPIIADVDGFMSGHPRIRPSIG